MRLALAAALAAAPACRSAAPVRTRVDVDVRNARAAAVVVTPWKGAAEVVVPPNGRALVSATAPPEPWRFRVVDQATGREISDADLRLNGAHGVVVRDDGVTVDTAHDGLDLDPHSTPPGS